MVGVWLASYWFLTRVGYPRKHHKEQFMDIGIDHGLQLSVGSIFFFFPLLCSFFFFFLIFSKISCVNDSTDQPLLDHWVHILMAHCFVVMGWSRHVFNVNYSWLKIFVYFFRNHSSRWTIECWIGHFFFSNTCRWFLELLFSFGVSHSWVTSALSMQGVQWTYKLLGRLILLLFQYLFISVFLFLCSLACICFDFFPTLSLI